VTRHRDDRGQLIREFMLRYQRIHGRPASVREIGAAVGLSSTSGVHRHLEQLERMGLVRREACRPAVALAPRFSQPAEALAAAFVEADLGAGMHDAERVLDALWRAGYVVALSPAANVDASRVVA